MHRIVGPSLGILLATPSLAFAINLQVHIKGVKPELANSIEADLTLAQARKEEKLSQARIKNLYQLATKQINATLEAKGYYHAQVR